MEIRAGMESHKIFSRYEHARTRLRAVVFDFAEPRDSAFVCFESRADSFVDSLRNVVNHFVKNAVRFALVEFIRTNLTAEFFKHVHHRDYPQRADVEECTKSESGMHFL